MALHEAAMNDDYFISRKLAPNVDFWSVNLLPAPLHVLTTLLLGGKCFHVQNVISCAF